MLGRIRQKKKGKTAENNLSCVILESNKKKKAIL